ncbi:hypothetical protein FALBO_11724 [Fusarium albosuccineum]|uniref:Uncharacterized protein n=1 Tax=Fusarium albosuccineum TaxID=1237068 RepID=A0A8H4L5C5_9HYPO|nr:hypothetical protein FALBO_11724 [Fusarium albosuccineum]
MVEAAAEDGSQDRSAVRGAWAKGNDQAKPQEAIELGPFSVASKGNGQGRPAAGTPRGRRARQAPWHALSVYKSGGRKTCKRIPRRPGGFTGSIRSVLVE